MTKQLFIIQYKPDGAGCPHHISQEVKPEKWEWNNYETNPHAITIENKYEIAITDPQIHVIDFDFYGSITKFVSQDFLDLCEVFHVNYRAVPLDLRFADGTKPPKSYFAFLPGDYIALLDQDRSEAEVETVVETGEAMTNTIIPTTPMYSKITKFVPKDIQTPHLFFCVDIFQLVSTNDFMKAAVEKNLRGIDFTALNSEYLYDPWADW